MADNIYTLGAWLCVAVGVAMCQDNTVCLPTDYTPLPNAPVRPTISSYYSVHMEANIKNRNYTSDYHEWFDGANNRSALFTTTANLKTQDIYSFNTNELFHINTDSALCNLQKLSTAQNLWVFGHPDSTGKARMYSAAGAFHFGDNPERHINKTFVRGIRCDLWRSCQFWKELNSTMILDWYFSDPNWSTSNLGFQVPVRAHVYGTTWVNHKSRKFDHIYDFVDYETKPKSTSELNSVFETPDGAYCPQRKNTKPLPTPASAFHFTAEILVTEQTAITFIKEYYDYDLNLVRYDSAPQGIVYGSNPQTQVHDFNTGIAYIIDDIRGNCTATNISSTGFDSHSTDASHVRIRTSKEFFYFDRTNYTYEGTKTVRNIKADVWIAQRSDWPKPNSPKSIWQWYFATPEYTQNIPDQLQFGLPIRLTVNSARGHYIYNIYDYDEQRPTIWSYDISRCYNSTERKDFSISLKGDFKSVVSTHLERFKYSVIQSITKAGSQGNSVLSALRINNIQVDYTSGTNIVVTFTLLDKSPPIGDVNNPKTEADLNTVSTRVSGAINSQQFVVKLNAPSMKQAVFMTATPYSMTPTQRITVKNAFVQPLVQTTSSTSGVSGGAMAGLGVGLLVVFFVVGVLSMYMYYRRQGGAFLPKKFGTEGDITNST